MSSKARGVDQADGVGEQTDEGDRGERERCPGKLPATWMTVTPSSTANSTGAGFIGCSRPGLDGAHSGGLRRAPIVERHAGPAARRASGGGTEQLKDARQFTLGALQRIRKPRRHVCWEVPHAGISTIDVGRGLGAC
jgi:hypothetical protein